MNTILKGHTGDFNNSVAASPDKKLVATVSDDMTVRVWEVATGECKRVLHHNKEVTHVSWSPKGDTIASCTDQVYIWGTPPRILKIVKRGQPYRLKTFWSPDGKFLAVMEGYSRGIILYETEGFRKVSELVMNSVRALCWTPDSRNIIFGALSATQYHVFMASVYNNTGEVSIGFTLPLLCYDGELTATYCTSPGVLFVGGYAEDIQTCDLTHLFHREKIDRRVSVYRQFDRSSRVHEELSEVVWNITEYNGWVVIDQEEYLCVMDYQGNRVSVFRYPSGECLGLVGPYVVMSYNEREDEEEYEYAAQIVEIPFFRFTTILSGVLSKPMGKLSDPRIFDRILTHIG